MIPLRSGTRPVIIRKQFNTAVNVPTASAGFKRPNMTTVDDRPAFATTSIPASTPEENKQRPNVSDELNRASNWLPTEPALTNSDKQAASDGLGPFDGLGRLLGGLATRPPCRRTKLAADRPTANS